MARNNQLYEHDEENNWVGGRRVEDNVFAINFEREREEHMTSACFCSEI